MAAVRASLKLRSSPPRSHFAEVNGPARSARYNDSAHGAPKGHCVQLDTKQRDLPGPGRGGRCASRSALSGRQRGPARAVPSAPSPTLFLWGKKGGPFLSPSSHCESLGSRLPGITPRQSLQLQPLPV
ncbi:hypothetical protein NDU88_006326 [Pleurodeles waltl]|uniref:Uncharacterized protein n=1 Tax=Pleurodeles waltl TaxID=8319 RepID=A0AAV7MFF6_PLEWA|nr:hypothetical protein NDU88_006326 [Pleurodeles waltl]